MASFTLTRPDKYPTGTTVSAYLASNWPPTKQPPSGDPQGSSVTSAVATDSGVTFTGLADNTRYYAHADVSGDDRYVGFGTPVSVGSGGTGARYIGDVVGDSIARGVGVPNSTLQGFVAKVARGLGAQINEFAHGGAMAHASGVAGVGSGGWGWFLGAQTLHAYYPPQGWPTSPAQSLPIRDFAIVKYGHNDASDLGAGFTEPFKVALRNFISGLLTCNSIDTTDASWAFTNGTWANAMTAGFAAGPEANFQYTDTEGADATLTIPAGALEAGRVLAIVLTVPAAAEYTVTPYHDGVAQTPILLRGADICGQGSGGRQNQYVYRTTALSDGAGHTIAFDLTDHVAGFFQVDGARIEAAADEAPNIVLPGLHRCTDYSYFASAGHANGASMSDARVEEFDQALQDVVAEFDAAAYVDVDAVINKSTALLADGVHPNSRGHAAIADAVNEVLGPLLAARDASKTSPMAGGPFGGLFVGFTDGPALGSPWATNASENIPLRLTRDFINGRIYVLGALSGGTTQNITTLPLGWRPGRNMRLVGRSTTNGLQIWQVTRAGVVSILAGGNATLSEVLPQDYAPAV